MKNKDPKQQIAETLKDAENILVTVNANPSVDELSAALGLTLLLNKLDKHATAVFSGDIPPAITFLDPEKTFENTTNSLQDFIIALDKEKADHLRYKVDGDLVKIFITPYRTHISQDDLEFSMGDFNVEAVVAIGVQNTDDFDAALADHGRIMHDATVASIGIGDLNSQLGSINWNERDASSYSEMVANLGESIRTDKTLIDEQIATALLTGVVAATERFSNEHTTSKVMTLAAQLMAAGANQQLIATHLEDAEEQEQEKPHDDESTSVKIDREDETNDTKKVEEEPEKPAPTPDDEPAPDGSINISHEKHGTVDEVAQQVAEERQEEAAKEAEEELASVQSTADDEQQLADQLSKAAAAMPTINDQLAAATASSESQDETDEPTFGGVLNATTEEAAEEKRIAEAAAQNHTLLSHGGSQYVGQAPDTLPPVNSFSQTSEEPVASDALEQDLAPTLRAPTVQPIVQPVPAEVPGLPELPPLPSVENMTLAEIDAANRAPHEEARAAIDAAFSNAPEQVLPQLPPMPDFSTLPPLPPLPEVPQVTATATPEPSFFQPMPAPQSPEPAPEQTLESLLPPLPAMSPVAPSQPQTFDPGQFQIPGQK